MNSKNAERWEELRKVNPNLAMEYLRIYTTMEKAQKHFNKSASKLTAGECALIAATLPNPKRFNSANPSNYMLKRKAKILSLMSKIPPVSFD